MYRNLSQCQRLLVGVVAGLFMVPAQAQSEGAGARLECPMAADYLANRPDRHDFGAAGEDCRRSADPEVLGEQAKVVDLRPASEFAAIHIPGSLNMSRTELLSSAWLREDPVWVIARPHNEQRIERLCARADQSGFTDFQVVRGGLRGWRTSGGSLNEVQHRARSLGTLPVAAVVDGALSGSMTLVVEASSENQWRSVLPEGAAMEVISDDERSAQLLRLMERKGQYVALPPLAGAAKELGLLRLYVSDATPAMLAAGFDKAVRSAEQYGAVPERYRCGA